MIITILEHGSIILIQEDGYSRMHYYSSIVHTHNAGTIRSDGVIHLDYGRKLKAEAVIRQVTRTKLRKSYLMESGTLQTQ